MALRRYRRSTVSMQPKIDVALSDLADDFWVPKVIGMNRVPAPVRSTASASTSTFGRSFFTPSMVEFRIRLTLRSM